jgi:hypothetical protein
MALLPADMMAMSNRLLSQLEGKKPEDMAPALLFALGRLAGKHGVRERTAAEFWKQHSNDMARSLFVMGFELERKNKAGG